MAPELLRGVGGILINQQGQRFCNELGRRDYVTKMIEENCEKIRDENDYIIERKEYYCKYRR